MHGIFSSFFFSCAHTEGATWLTLRRVLILLCAAAAEVHPAQVVPVCYPVVGTASAVRCGVSPHRAWGRTEAGREGVGGGGTEQGN